MTKKTWIIFTVVCVALLGAIIFFSKKDNIDVSGVNPDKLITKGQYADHIFGNKNAKVILIEYGDFQCPYCGQAEPQVAAIIDEYKDHIAFVFRNFPLTNNHPNALAAATAAEAVSKESSDLYWKMHDSLYAHQQSWNNASVEERKGLFEKYAQAVGAQLSSYRTNVEDSQTMNKINFDLALGTKLGVSGTPAFFLNGKKIDDTTYNDLVNKQGNVLRAKLNDLIKAAGDTPPSIQVK